MSRSTALATALLACAAALLLSAFLLALPARAQITLLADAEQRADWSRPASLIAYDGALYFSAYTASTGRELYRYDGTSASLVEDFRFGRYSGEPSHLTVYDEHLVFGAELRSFRLTPYAYDPATGVLTDFVEQSGIQMQDVEGFVPYGGRLFFSASDGTRRALYRYHTDSGVEEVAPDSAFGEVSGVLASGGALLFSAETAANPGTKRLYAYASSDGLATPVASPVTAFSAAISLGGQIYLAADAGGGLGEELYVYDTLAGTLALAADVLPGEAGASPRGFAVYDDRIFFAGADADGAPALYVYDPATGEAQEAAPDTRLTGTVEEPSPLAVYQDRLYFSGFGDGGTGLLAYDGATGETTQAGELQIFGGRIAASDFAVFEDALYFQSYQEDAGYELFRYDGAALELAADLAGTRGSSPALLGVLGGKLLFGERTNALPGYLHTYDPATGGYTDIDVQLAAALPAFPHGGRLYFTGRDAFTSETGWELYAYDPVTGAARLVSDLNPGAASSTPGGFAVLGDLLYFTATTEATGQELFVYDPAAGETRLAVEIAPGEASSYLKLVTEHAGKLYFSARTDATGDELFAYDPTTGTAELVWDALPGRTSSGVTGMLSWRGRLYLGAWEGESNARRELLAYDADTDVMELIADIHPGGSSSPEHLTALGEKLVFTAYTEALGEELYVYDSATGTTELVADIAPGEEGSAPADLVAADGKVYFSAQTRATGRELYAYDPETGTAELVQDLEPGPGWSDPGDLRVVGDALYFHATTSATGTEVWYLPAVAPVAVARASEASAVRLSPPAPNPASNTARLTLHLGATQHVTATVYDLLGRAVLRLADGLLEGGRAHTLIVEAGQLPAGTYFVHARGERFGQTQALTVAR